MTEDQLRELASQLSNPTGENGLHIADMMASGNREMVNRGMEALQLSPADAVLELGHANAPHMKQLLDSSPNISYTGLEISTDMQAAATQHFKSLGYMNEVSFELYDGVSIPIGSDSIDKALTVNTIYFWQKPMQLTNELFRVLKPGGTIALVFAPKSFMQNLPFTKHGFTLYDVDEADALLTDAGFVDREPLEFSDSPLTKTGEKVNRPFFVLRAKKPV